MSEKDELNELDDRHVELINKNKELTRMLRDIKSQLLDGGDFKKDSAIILAINEKI